jgi:predicted metal-binding membrane protein
MIYNAREYARLRNCVFSISLIAWIVILLESSGSSCCAPNELKVLLALNPAVLWARDWGLMLIAMMAPTLAPAIYHIRISSLAVRRARSLAFFTVGFGVVWMAVGSVMLAIELGAKWWASQSYLPVTVVCAIALVWQASPLKQRCLNRTHSHKALAAFGATADWDVFKMGWEHGVWCTGSCWAAMLFPILLPERHLLAMVAVSTLMSCERLDPPKTPSWRWRGFGTAFRYLRLRVCGPRSRLVPFAIGGQV